MGCARPGAWGWSHGPPGLAGDSCPSATNQDLKLTRQDFPDYFFYYFVWPNPEGAGTSPAPIWELGSCWRADPKSNLQQLEAAHASSHQEEGRSRGLFSSAHQNVSILWFLKKEIVNVSALSLLSKHFTARSPCLRSALISAPAMGIEAPPIWEWWH